jgi:2-dehydropantoate 2-reductase
MSESMTDVAAGPEFEFAILGAGAIGSILGAHLVRAGRSVVMLARGKRGEHIQREGLRITGLVELSSPVHVLRDASLLRSAGVLIVATKTPGTAEALASLHGAHVGAAFSIQNGPMKNELLADAFGALRVLGSLADTSGEMLAGGEVVFTRNVNILLGELSGEASARARDIAAVIDSSGVRTTAVAHIRKLEWSKFVTWVGLVALSVTIRAPTWRYLTDPASVLVLVRMTREMGRLADALGIELTDKAVLPTASLCRGTEEDAVEAVMRVGREFASNAPDHRMSALQDLDAGRPLEIHETLGYALRKAAGCGVSMPLVHAFYSVISAGERVRMATLTPPAVV